MTIYCVVPVHNRIAMTLRFLDSLDLQTVHESISVLVVDDGSTDGTAEVLRNRSGRYPIQLLSGDGSWWWGGSVWRAVQLVRASARQDDWIFLANNDTVLHPDCVAHLLETGSRNDRTVVGGRSIEIWPDGTRHPVSSGFLIDQASLSVQAVDGHSTAIQEVDALAGRGILIPVSALPFVDMYPRLMPQHFADLNLTGQMKAKGYTLIVDHRAESLEIDRASSAVELGQQHRPSLNKASPMYVPALAGFWWLQTPPFQRLKLPLRALKRLRSRQTLI